MPSKKKIHSAPQWKPGPIHSSPSSTHSVPVAAQTALHPVMLLQSSFGNRTVQRFFHHRVSQGVIQGVFTFSPDEKSAVDNGAPPKTYRILGSITYNKGANTAYWMENIANPDETIYADKATGLEVTPTDVTSGVKRVRKDDEDDVSDFSESDDDSRSTLNAFGKQRLLIKKGRHKKKKLAAVKLEKETASSRFRLDTARRRKALAVHRLKRTTGISDVDAEEYVDVGKQTLHIGKGTGFFIMPGGNVRPPAVKEPPSDYNALFTQMQGLGKDPAAALLYKKAAKVELPSGATTLSDPQIAAMALFYMNANASQLETELGQRTQLTEDLSKLTTITGFSEFSRSMNATETGTPTAMESPYDASLFVKRGLLKVSKGEGSLQNTFFQGPGGQDSVFMGAPSKENSPSKIGGSEVLQNPFLYPDRLERQMSIFPDLKKDFKTSLNELKSTTSASDLTALTPSDLTLLETKAKQQQKADAVKMLEAVKKVKIPTASFDKLSFWADSDGYIQKQRKMLATMMRKAKGNTEAETVLKQVAQELLEKEKNARK